MSWTIVTADLAARQLAKLPKQQAARIYRFLNEELSKIENPRWKGRPMIGPAHHWRYRVGDYRIICDIQDHKLVVLVVEVGHRSEIYR